MTTIWERASNIVVLILCLSVILVAFHFALDGSTSVLIDHVPGNGLPFTLLIRSVY